MPSDPARVRDIFLAAAELPAAERPAYLAERCGPDAELRAAVERLLAAHADPASLLEPPVAPLPLTDSHTPQPDYGTVIAGRYKLLEPIGEGGMGEVWVAQQTEPIKRTVAVKLIKPGMDSKTVLARFDAERQALALMDHPNIARVFDAGATPDGRPFFVMELVRGVPITQFCDSRRFNPRQRLELFVPACQAIQHAHQKGIIHRDIKPSNVLVALYDDRPVPKVIDFGVAKATSQPLTEQTLHTGFGTVIGTPQYMSPEQATFNNMDVDTRSDVYSLGVLLYELLVGSTPFTKKDLERAGVLEMLRVVREVEPPRPSTKLSTADALPSLAANRGTEPRALTGMLRNELDWVVMKALEKDRTRRYETANGFAADVLRYLSGEQVQAVPPSLGYRVRKFVSKHKGPVLAVSVVVLAIVVGSGVSLGFGLEANKQAEEAKRKQKDADEAAAREKGEAQRADRERNDAITARNDLKEKNDELIRSQEQVNRTLAKALLGPITSKNRANLLTDHELEAFWQIAELRRAEVAGMFLEEVTRTALSCAQFECRAEYVLHAAIGLDPARRDAADRLFRVRLGEPDAQGSRRVNLASSISRADFVSPETAATAARTLTDALAKETNPIARKQLAQGLVAVVSRLEPAEASKFCTEAARILTDALAKERNLNARIPLAQGLAAVVSQMEPAEAARILIDALAKEKYPLARVPLAQGLAAVASQMKPAASAKFCTEAARILIDALAKETNPSARVPLVQGLAAVASQMKPAEASKFCTEAARILTDALAKETNPLDRHQLAQGLADVASQMEPAAAAKVCTEAARILIDALTRETNLNARHQLARGVAAVASQMKPAEATSILTDALAKETNPIARHQLAQGLADIASQMEPAEAVRMLMEAFAKETSPSVRGPLAKGLADVALGLSGNARTRSQRATLLATGSFATPHNLLPALGLLHPNFHPQPRPLPPQELVELLKHPFCVGEARRAVLDALEFTYQRKFKDQWEFVEYAQKHQKQLDLLSPPKRLQQP